MKTLLLIITATIILIGCEKDNPNPSGPEKVKSSQNIVQRDKGISNLTAESFYSYFQSFVNLMLIQEVEIISRTQI